MYRPVRPTIRTRWKPGSTEAAQGPLLVSATVFDYRRWRDLPAVALHAWRLRRTWGTRPGAVGLLTGIAPMAGVTFSISVWRSEADLRRFLRAPEHLRLMRDYRPRLRDSRSVVWETDRFSPERAWDEALERLRQSR